LDANNQQVGSGVVSIGPNAQTTVIHSGTFGNISLRIASLKLTVDTTCVRPPAYVLEGACLENNGSARFTISNNGGTPATLPSFSVVDQNNTQVRGGQVSSFPFTFDVTGAYDSLTLSLVGDSQTQPINVSNCFEAPKFSASGVCLENNGGFRFSISNGGGAPLTTPSYTVVDDQQNEVASGTVSLPFSQDFTGAYSALTLTVREGETVLTESVLNTCYLPPALTPSVVCLENNGGFRFSVINNGGVPLGSLSYRIVDQNSNTVSDGTLSLPFSQDVTGPYSRLTLNITGSNGESVAQISGTTCYKAPSFAVSGVCLEGNGSARFTISNRGGTPLGQIPGFTITDQDGETVQSGAVDGLPFSVDVSGEYDSLSFVLDDESARAEVSNCFEEPNYTVEGYCSEGNGQFAFEVSNAGGAPLRSLPRYTITDQEGNILDSGNLKSLPFTPIIVGPYGEVTLSLFEAEDESSEPLAIVVRRQAECYIAPEFTVEGVCLRGNGLYQFSVANNGGQPLGSLPTFEVRDSNNALVADGLLPQLPFVFVYQGAASSLTFSLAGVQAQTPTLRCYSPASPPSVIPPGTTPPAAPPPSQPPAPPSTTNLCGLAANQPFGAVPVVNMPPFCVENDVEKPNTNWTAIPIEPATCPDWLVYHTDMTGDWEIFRLGEADFAPDADPNLSKGTDVIDMRPTRSPDSKHIAFTSNRDGNFEIYIAAVDGSLMQRVTDNQSLDLDPAWSPDGTRIAYYSNVSGNWELWVVDVTTGVKTQLTDSPANDINPFWSPDSRKVVFQSDSEDGLWQLYTYDFASGEIVRLSDGMGDDIDPQYSNDGSKIAFLSTRDDENGVITTIYVMNADGTGLTRVSEVGGRASNIAWSPDDTLIAYQSDVANGVNDIYVYEVATGKTRLITNNTADYAGIQDVAPTWYCDSTILVFTSNVESLSDGNSANNNIYSVNALPIDGEPIDVDKTASQLTEDEGNDRDPQNTPSEEESSNGGALPSKFTGN
jgi:TolB protein